MTDKKPSTIIKVLTVFGAWVSVVVLGIVMFAVTTLVAGAVLGEYESSLDVSRVFLIDGMLGLILLAILLLAVWRARKRLFAKHFLIGLWIGLGLYALMAAISIVAVAVGETKGSGVTGTTSCSTTLAQQLEKTNAAVIPIATDLGTGTGFAVSADGLVVTADHVVAGASDMYANWTTGRVGLAEVARYPDYDVALLRLAQPTPEYVQFTSAYAVTDDLYAIGYPANTFSAGQASVTSGIVSRILTNSDLKLNSADAPLGLEVVQTDTALNPGNSGGPLINRCGVVGVISAKSDSLGFQEYGLVSEEGISYAISSKTVTDIFKLPLYSY